MEQNEQVQEIESPVLVERKCGGWLALPGLKSRFRFAVRGDTADEAGAAYQLARAGWISDIEKASA